MSDRRSLSLRPADPVASFAAALAIVVRIEDELHFGHAVALLDDEGWVHDLTVFCDPRVHTIDTALAWARRRLVTDRTATRLILFSVGVAGATALRAGDVEYYLRLQDALADEGVTVLDWLRTDGDGVHSMAFELQHAVWPPAGREPTRGSPGTPAPGDRPPRDRPPGGEPDPRGGPGHEGGAS